MKKHNFISASPRQAARCLRRPEVLELWRVPSVEAVVDEHDLLAAAAQSERPRADAVNKLLPGVQFVVDRNDD